MRRPPCRRFRLPPLDADRNVAVAIVGGGFAGLSTALHLAEQGIEALVLEAREPGWGASGNNGGQLNPGLKLDPDTVEAEFGADLGARMIAFSYQYAGLHARADPPARDCLRRPPERHACAPPITSATPALSRPRRRSASAAACRYACSIAMSCDR